MQRSTTRHAIPGGPLLGMSLRLCIDDLIHRIVAVRRIAMILSDFERPNFDRWEKNVLLLYTHSWWTRDHSFVRRLV